jgi:glucose-1-phosphate adenylyltransferase
MRNVVALVLGGGRGTRLYPLTKYRSKPAVPLAGKYRLIDVPISNCINSDINRIYVMTQFNSVSLHRHIRRTYQFDAFTGGFVEILAAQQTVDNNQWFQGTADAVRQHIRYIQEPDIKYVLILSGDQLYRMDYSDMLKTHMDTGADVTIGAMPVTRDAAHAFGIMRGDENGRVEGFLEKPKTDAEMNMVASSPEWIDSQGIPSQGRDLLASMGIYLFNRDTLVDVLTKTDYHDFGKEVFPASIRSRRVQMHLFDGYWEDIGTIKSFFECNLALAKNPAPFELASAEAPIYTRARFLPPSRIDNATISNSLISDGCQIESGAVIENSVLGLRMRVGKNAVIRNSIIMGADEYESVETIQQNISAGIVPIGIGEGSVIEDAIVDFNCRIGRNVRVVNEKKLQETKEVREGMICDGIVMIHKNTTLRDGWQLVGTMG